MSDLREQLQRALGDAYALDRELGGGGMSRVFVATERALGRQVVVKILPAEMAGQVSVERFKREISLAAKLQHPHIVPLLTAGDAGGLPFFTMPLVEGESLRARLSKHGELPLNEAVRVLREIASALAYAHERGIVHRDIKPDNVLLSGGSAMVTDFGVAKALSSSSNAEEGKATSLGVALGTPAYMAPEQATADPSVDHRADVYAFGVLAYELLTGQPPFVGRTPQNLLAAHVTEAPENITRRRTAIPPALAAMVMRCLEKRAADRPQTANELVHALDQINTPSGGTHPTSAVAAHSTPQPEPVARSRARLVGVMVAVVAIATALWVAFRPGGAGAPRSLAVLPTDVATDTSHAYLADGLSNELTTRLTKIPGLEVRAYSSSRVMRGKGAREAGKELSVGAIVTASVVRSGSQLRVTASLVNAADESVIWSDVFPASDGDQFALQDQLVTAISSALKVSLSPETKAAVTARGTKSSEAHDLVQRARFLTDQFTRSSLMQAIAAADAAIRLDSTYAEAWAASAGAWGTLTDDFESPLVTGPHLLPAAERAYALDSSSAPAAAQLASLTYWYKKDVPRAISLFERALRLDSTNVDAVWFAFPLYYNRGMPDSARRVLERVIRHNPLSRFGWEILAGFTDFDRISPDSGKALCDRLQHAVNNPGRLCRARQKLAAGDRAGALAELKLRVALATGAADQAQNALWYGRLGDTAAARQQATNALKARGTGYLREDFMARVYAAVGDREEAIRWWQSAEKSNSAGLANLGYEREDSTILSDPRIVAIRSRLKQR